MSCLCAERTPAFFGNAYQNSRSRRVGYVAAFFRELCHFGGYTLTGVRRWLQNPELLAAFGILQQLWNKDYEVSLDAGDDFMLHSLAVQSEPP